MKALGKTDQMETFDPLVQAQTHARPHAHKHTQSPPIGKGISNPHMETGGWGDGVTGGIFHGFWGEKRWKETGPARSRESDKGDKMEVPLFRTPKTKSEEGRAGAT